MSQKFNLDLRKDRRNRYSARELEIIRENYPSLGAAGVLEKLIESGGKARSKNQVRNKAQRMGLRMTNQARAKIAKERSDKFPNNSLFTPEMESVLRAYYPGNGANKTAKRLKDLGFGDFRPRTVCNRANRLNIRVNRKGREKVAETAASKRREGYNLRYKGRPRNDERERSRAEEMAAARVHPSVIPWGLATKRAPYASICLENPFVRRRAVRRGLCDHRQGG